MHAKPLTALLAALALASAGCLPRGIFPRAPRAGGVGVAAEAATAGYPLLGTVDLAAFGYRTQAIGTQVVVAATVSLIDPDSGESIATGLTDDRGAFTLMVPQGTTLQAGKFYYVEAVKGLNQNLPGNVAARMRTLASWSGTAWSGMGGRLTISLGTTALVAAAMLKRAAGKTVDFAALSAAITLEVADAAVGTPDTFAGVENLSVDEFGDAYAIASQALAVDRDPVQAMWYDVEGGLFGFAAANLSAQVREVRPTLGTVGSEIEILGTGFDPARGNTKVRFGNGAEAIVRNSAGDRLTVAVPDRSLSGVLSVQVGNRIYIGPQFGVLPNLTSLSVSSAFTEQTLLVFGTGFSPVPWANLVKIGNVQAKVKSADWTKLEIEVPGAAQTGQVTVTTAGGLGPSAASLTLMPHIDSIAKRKVGNRTLLEIQGSGFGAQGSVKIGPTTCAVELWTPSLAMVDATDANPGHVVVTTGALLASAPVEYRRTFHGNADAVVLSAGSASTVGQLVDLIAAAGSSGSPGLAFLARLNNTKTMISTGRSTKPMKSLACGAIGTFLVGRPIIPVKSPCDISTTGHLASIRQILSHLGQIRAILDRIDDPDGKPTYMESLEIEGQLVETIGLAVRTSGGSNPRLENLLNELVRIMDMPTHPDLAARHFDRLTAMRDIIRGAHKAARISQGEGSMTCAAASVQVMLLMTRPEAYFPLITGLITAGKGQLGYTETGNPRYVQLSTAEFDRDVLGRRPVDAIMQGSIVEFAHQNSPRPESIRNALGRIEFKDLVLDMTSNLSASGAVGLGSRAQLEEELGGARSSTGTVAGGGRSGTWTVAGGGRAAGDASYGGGRSAAYAEYGGGRDGTSAVYGGARAALLAAFGGGRYNYDAVFGGGRTAAESVLSGSRNAFSAEYGGASEGLTLSQIGFLLAGGVSPFNQVLSVWDETANQVISGIVQDVPANGGVLRAGEVAPTEAAVIGILTASGFAHAVLYLGTSGPSTARFYDPIYEQTEYLSNVDGISTADGTLQVVALDTLRDALIAVSYRDGGQLDKVADFTATLE